MRMEEGGLTLLYHNHGYGLGDMEGEVPFELLLERTDPNVVAMEMDVYWMVAGGADPVEYLSAYPDHFQLLHIKDMAEEVRFSGDGETPSSWAELFPYMADPGSGVLDLPAIIKQARNAGVQHYHLERDQAPDEKKTLKTGYRYLSSLQVEN
jgi:sugar phosphate isomerase/epimerase